jgi:hypothetical protein
MTTTGDSGCTNSQHRDNEVAPMHVPSDHIITMQEPSEEAEASISTENVREGPNLNCTFPARRKAAKRTLPWDLSVDELELVSPPPPPEAEDIQARKKPRLEEPFSASTDEAATILSSHDTPVSLPADVNHAVADPVKGKRAIFHWTPEADAKLTSAVTNTCKKKRGKEYKKNWVAIATLIPDRMRTQCRDRWHNALDPKIVRAAGCTGKWDEDEDRKLKDAVQIHGGKDWVAIGALAPGRTKSQCCSRWHYLLKRKID